MNLPFLRMRNSLQHYAWGSSQAIPQLLGIDNSSEQPVAECWMGAHPAAPSQLYEAAASPSAGRPFDQCIAEAPLRYLGAVSQRRFGNRLPFLFKLLSANQALSIQAHPNLSQAQAGYAREEAQGIDLHSPTRSYKDPSHKPEMVYSLTTYWAMCGFRTLSEIIKQFSLPPLAQHPVIGDILQRLNSQDPTALSYFLRQLLEIKGKAREQLLEAASQLVDAHAPPVKRRELEQHDIAAARYWWVGELMRQFPNDTGALAPFYLNVIKLPPQRALFLGAGMLHAYLHGTAIEVMANSDNVLRGGLTSKHINKEELMHILDFSPQSPTWVEPQPEGTLQRFPVAADEFELSYLQLEAAPKTLAGPPSPKIALLLEGQAQITAEDSQVTLQRGQSLFIFPEINTLTASGSGKLFLVTVARRLFTV